MANNIAVSITADVADLQVKRAIMSAELKTATKDLNDFARQAASSGSTDGLREGMLASATAAEKARTGIAQVNAELKGMGAKAKPAIEDVEHGLAEIAIKAREMAAQVRESFASIREMRESMVGFGEVMMAAFAVERIAEWAKEFGEASEKVQHLSETFGVSTAQIQGFKVLADTTGISLETITRGLGILDKNLVMNVGSAKGLGAILSQMGLSASDAKDQMGALIKVAEKFKDMDDGPKKVALAMELFGKSGKDLIPILNMGSQGLEDLKNKAQEYGAAFTPMADSAQAKGLALADSIDETAVAWQGVTNVLGDAFGPILKEVTDSLNLMIKAFVDSYTEGGIVAVIFMDIKAVIEEVGAVIDFFVGLIKELWSAFLDIVEAIVGPFTGAFGDKMPSAVRIMEIELNLFKDVFIILKDVIIVCVEIIKGAIVGLIDTIHMFSVIAEDAFTMNWGAIAADWKSGIDVITNHAIASAHKIKDAYTEAAAAMAAAMHGEAPAAAAKPKESPHMGAGDFDPKMGGGHEKKPKDDLVQRLDDELTAKKLAWAMEQDAHGTAIAYSLQAEADYWKQILDGTDLSAKNRAAIETKYLAAHSQLVKERIAIVIDGYKQEIAEAGKNSAAKLAIANRELEYIGKTFGAESKEYAQAQAEIVRIKREAAEQIKQLDEIRAQSVDKINLSSIATEEAVAKQRVAMGVETNAQLLTQQQVFENRRYAIEEAATQRARALVNPKDDPVRAAQLDAQLEALEIQHQQKLTQIEQQAVLQRTAIERTGINSVASSWSQAIGKMVTLQAGFGATVRSLWVGLQQAIGNAIAQIIENWLAKEITAFAIKHGLMATEGALTVTSEAAKAGAGGIASMAAAPFPLNLTAPAFGASMAAAAAAFGPAASAAGGWWEVPGDTVTRLHPKEMVLPAWAAQPLRSMLGGGAANNNAPPAANQNGGQHFHGPVIMGDLHAMDSQSAEKFLMKHKRHVAAAGDAGVRAGYQPKNGTR